VNKFDKGPKKDFESLTATSCINQNLLNTSCFYWSSDAKNIAKTAQDFTLTEKEISEIHAWVDQRFKAKELGWPNLFYSLECLNDYKAAFFTDRTDLVSLSLSFTESESKKLIKDFKPQSGHTGEVGLYKMLKQNIPENPDGIFIGYDLIQPELDGSFHSIHCRLTKDELKNELRLTLNEHGLFEENASWEKIINYCNNESNGLTGAGPWYYCKIRKY